MLTEIHKYMPSFLLKLYQRKTLDRNAVITPEELLEAERELAEEIKYVQYRMECLHNACQMLKKLIKKEDLL